MKRRFYRKIIRGLSLTSIMFVFQACYGTPQDFGNDIYLSGVVTSAKTGKPIKGIKVSLGHTYQYELTDSAGKFGMYVPELSMYNIQFADVDSIDNGNFITQDTSLVALKDTIHVNVILASR
ncbi:MAG: hypothetical protein PHT07_00420 [Paludibacter sp.]|nr:hypothetical protein [Paludibacter sp.]